MASSSSSAAKFLLLLLCLSCCLSPSTPCFIRNCPIGGKRNSLSRHISAQKECMSCGPDGLGQCVGPNICCGPSIGCFMGTEESRICAAENDSPVPCKVEGPSCATGDGICVADEICCTEDKCSMDSSCQSNSQNREELSQDLLRYMHRLMEVKGLTRK